MPYISEELRQTQVDEINGYETSLEEAVDRLIHSIRKTWSLEQFQDCDMDGIANYVASRCAVGIRKPLAGKFGYAERKNCVDALQEAAAEARRRLLQGRSGNGYEDQCIEKNGDIPEYLGV